MIDQVTIDKIFSAADIVEVISDFVNLKKAGQNYKGLSPFTNEKTPSFFVSPAKGIFKCFSSGIGGNAVSFLMEHEKLSYPEALRYLAKKYNIEIVEKELSEEEKQEVNERESMLAVTSFAQKQFSEWLWNREEGRAVGLSYFRERGFREPVIRHFQLGYSPEQRDAFTRLSIDKGYKKDFLVKTGLTIEKSNYTFDRFAGRVIFPIHSLSGQVIGFGGRILKSDEKAAKYLNSPESEIYHKSNVLYGLYFAKSDIIKQDKCYLVEGYTDVISMHQTGIENVVASSGTALTSEQIRLVKRFTKNITVLYDGDEAGIKASLRGIDLILEEGMNVKVLLLPEGEDPDSYARAHSAGEFADFITENESDFIRFKTKLLIKDAKNDPVQKATLITDIVRSIAVIPDNITRSVYVRECSKLLEIDEGILYNETFKIRKNKVLQKAKSSEYAPEITTQKKSQQAPLPLEDNFLLEKDIIRILLMYGREELKNTNGKNVAQYIVNEIKADDLEFQHPVYRKIFDEVARMVDENTEMRENHFISHIDVDISRTAADLLASNYEISQIWKKNDVRFETEDMKLKEIVPELVIAFKQKKVIALIKETQSEIAEAQKNNDNEKILLLQQKFIILNDLKKSFSKNLGNRIIN
jgi:DNA primase